MRARVGLYSWQLGSVYHRYDRLCNARAIKNSFFSFIFVNSAGMRARKMEQHLHFCTTADNVRIAYATVGQGPPLVKAANWLSHLEFDWQSPIWCHLLEVSGRICILTRASATSCDA